MDKEDIINMPICEIINLPNFHSITSRSGTENVIYPQSVGEPYWEIQFIATKNKNGRYDAFGIEIPHEYYVLYKFKNTK